MENVRAPAIIIGPPGLWRDSLKVVMEASRQIACVGTGDDWADGSKMIARLSPQLVVVDTDQLGDRFSWQTLQQHHLEYPRVAYCVVVHTRDEECLAWDAGAKVVLQAGFSTRLFFDALAEFTHTFPSLSSAEGGDWK